MSVTKAPDKLVFKENCAKAAQLTIAINEIGDACFLLRDENWDVLAWIPLTRDDFYHHFNTIDECYQKHGNELATRRAVEVACGNIKP